MSVRMGGLFIAKMGVIAVVGKQFGELSTFGDRFNKFLYDQISQALNKLRHFFLMLLSQVLKKVKHRP